MICSNWLNHPEATELAIFGSKVNRGYKEVNWAQIVWGFSGCSKQKDYPHFWVQVAARDFLELTISNWDHWGIYALGAELRAQLSSDIGSGCSNQLGAAGFLVFPSTSRQIWEHVTSCNLKSSKILRNLRFAISDFRGQTPCRHLYLGSSLYLGPDRRSLLETPKIHNPNMSSRFQKTQKPTDLQREIRIHQSKANNPPQINCIYSDFSAWCQRCCFPDEAEKKLQP